MKLRALVAAAAIVALAPATDVARAQLPELPVPLPPPPSLPVPVPPVPPVPPVAPPPPPPAPPPAPVPPAPSPSDVVGAVGSVASGVTGGGGGGGGGSSGGGGAGSSGGGGSAGGGTSGAATSAGTSATASQARRDRRVRASQSAVRNTGPARQRKAAVIRFTLARPAVVRFVVVRQSPDCVLVGAFSVRGRAGANRVTFDGRLRGEPLPPGTYLLRATAERRGRSVPLGRTRVVVVAPGEDPARARPAPSTCLPGELRDAVTGVRSRVAGAQAVATAAGADATDADAAATGASADDGDAGRGEGADPSDDESVAGAEAAGGGGASALPGLPTPFEGAPAWLQPLLLAALAASLLLLVAAALPATAVRPVGVAPVVDRRRVEFALTGAALLGVVSVAALVL